MKFLGKGARHLKRFVTAKVGIGIRFGIMVQARIRIRVSWLVIGNIQLRRSVVK